MKRVQNEDKIDVFLPPQKWQNWKVCEIISELSGDTANDIAPTFSSPDFAEALEQVGFTRADMSSENIQTYLDCVFERLDFHWDDVSEQFTPIPCAEDEPATSDNSNSSASTVN